MDAIGTKTAAATRLVSLDVFRGLTMAGDGDRQQSRRLGQRLLAAAARRLARLDAHRSHLPLLPLHRRRLDHAVAEVGELGLDPAARRLIFALGLFLAGYPRFNLERWRIPGVLQRIALCYLVAGGRSIGSTASGRPGRQTGRPIVIAGRRPRSLGARLLGGDDARRRRPAAWPAI